MDNVKYVSHEVIDIYGQKGFIYYYFKLSDEVANWIRKHTSYKKDRLRPHLDDNNLVVFRLCVSWTEFEDVHQPFIDEVEKVCNEGNEEYLYNHLILNNGRRRGPGEVHRQMREEYRLKGEEASVENRIEWWVALFIIHLGVLLFDDDPED